MKYLKLFENKNINDVLKIQEEYNLLRIKLKKHLILKPFNSFNEETCQLVSFEIGKSVIYFQYSDSEHYYSDNKNDEVDINDFMLFYNDEDEYKKIIRIQQDAKKYNL